MIKIKKIIKAWAMLMKNENTALVLSRAKICKECPHARVAFYKFFHLGKETGTEGLICDICKCPLTTKLRLVDEKCPKNNW